MVSGVDRSSSTLAIAVGIADKLLVLTAVKLPVWTAVIGCCC